MIKLRNNYAQSVTHFISIVRKDAGLQSILQNVCINLTCPGHYFAFDEALKQFGIMCNKVLLVKATDNALTSNIINNFDSFDYFNLTYNPYRLLYHMT